MNWHICEFLFGMTTTLQGIGADICYFQKLMVHKCILLKSTRKYWQYLAKKKRPISSVVEIWAARRWVMILIPAAGWDTLGRMLDSCFILCHMCASPHCCDGYHAC